MSCIWACSMLPHTVGEALKSAVYIAALYQSFGYDVTPKWDEPRQDIVQCLGLENPDSLVAFCQGVQSGSPIDSFVLPGRGICPAMTARW